MKFLECLIFVVVAVYTVVSAEADFGYFIPKAFYTLDADGHKTQPIPVTSHTAQYLRRLRRQVFSSSSSSSSSSVSSGNGGPIYFSTHNSVSQTPGGLVSVSSRFGDDGSNVPYDSPGTGSATASGSGYIGSGYGGSGYVGNGYIGNGYGVTYYDENSANNNHYDHRNKYYGTSGSNIPNRFGSSASSSSSVSSKGGPVYFRTEQSVAHTPTSNINVASRFGGDLPQTIRKTVSTSGYIDEKGVHANTTTTKNQ